MDEEAVKEKRMKILVSENPQKCGYNAVKDEVIITKDEMESMKLLVKKFRHTSDKDVVRKTEKDFYSEMSKIYGKTVAGELLAKVWLSARRIKES